MSSASLGWWESFLVAVADIGSHLGMLVGNLIGRARLGVAEILAGEGGVLLLALGSIGIVVLTFDLVLVGTRLVRGARRRAAVSPVIHDRTARAKTLASEGATIVEIARRTGLSHDALLLVVGAEIETARAAAAPSAAPKARPAIPALTPAPRPVARLMLRRARQAA